MTNKPEEMPENGNNYPLVTFALFAYNQEEYIREAVEGAFSQTYSPLEIILSDDCSSDRTFEIMSEMAEAYEGPHTVCVCQSPHNLGLAGHINRVARIFRGEILVVAAGDDISRPDRTSVLASEYAANHKVLSAYSANTYIAEKGSFIEDYFQPNKYDGKSLQDLAVENSPIAGSSASYHRSIFDLFEDLALDLIYEDRVLPFRAVMLGGKVAAIEQPLVRYRVSGGISDISGRSDSREKMCIFFDRERIVFDQRARDCKALGFVHEASLAQNRVMYLSFLCGPSIGWSTWYNILRSYSRRELTFYDIVRVFFMRHAFGVWALTHRVKVMSKSNAKTR